MTEAQWVIWVDLKGHPSAPRRAEGPNDEGQGIADLSYGLAWRGIGSTPEKALAEARAARKSALPAIERCARRLEGALARGSIDGEASFDHGLCHELRSYLGSSRVPTDRQTVTVETAQSWLADLESALAEG